MKQFLILLCVICAFNINIKAQNAGFYIGTNDGVANTNALLDIDSSNKGVLIPRMSSAERLAIFSAASEQSMDAAKSLMVYDSELSAFYFWNGKSWNALAGNGASTPSVTSVNGKKGDVNISSSDIISSGTAFPTPAVLDDLFVRSDEDILYRYNGSSWSALGNASAPSTPSVTSVNGKKGDVNISSSDIISSGTAFPTAAVANDLFIRSDEKMLYRFNGTTWDALGNATAPSTPSVTSVNGKKGDVNISSSDIISSGTAFPTAAAANDLFVRSDEKMLYRFNGTTWDALGNATAPSTPSVTSVNGKKGDVNISSSDIISSGTAFPTAAAANDLFVRSDEKIIYRFNGTTWDALGNATAPSGDSIILKYTGYDNPASEYFDVAGFIANDNKDKLLFKVDDNELYGYNNGAWTLINLNNENHDPIMHYSYNDDPASPNFDDDDYDPNNNERRFLYKESTNELFVVKSGAWFPVNSGNNADWYAFDPNSKAFIKNKPFVPKAVYNDPQNGNLDEDLIFNLTQNCFKYYYNGSWKNITINSPLGPAPNWAEADNQSHAYIANKPFIPSAVSADPTGANGDLIFNINEKCFKYYKDGAWVKIQFDEIINLTNRIDYIESLLASSAGGTDADGLETINKFNLVGKCMDIAFCIKSMWSKFAIVVPPHVTNYSDTEAGMEFFASAFIRDVTYFMKADPGLNVPGRDDSMLVISEVSREWTIKQVTTYRRSLNLIVDYYNTKYNGQVQKVN